ncbi:hypothetical protein AGMMS49982_00900 [Bacteroidia bacterium]|nr:hypothetical protein AGMMS49982_00900 [Bacteroidia bacterium]
MFIMQTIIKSVLSCVFVLLSIHLQAQGTIVGNGTDIPKQSAFRISIGGGYAKGIGEVLKYGDVVLDKMSEDLTTGFGLEAEMQYYFNWKKKDAFSYGIGLDFNYVHTKATAFFTFLPTTGVPNVSYLETQSYTYAGPAFAMRYDWDDWLCTFTLGCGAVFFTDYAEIDSGGKNIKGRSTTPAFGSNIGISADYKISPNWGFGLKLSATGGSVDEIDWNGVKVNFEKDISLSSWMISGIVSFRTK